MHTKTTKILSVISLRTIYVLMILSMLLAGVGIKPAHAASPSTISGNAGVAGATITWNGSGSGSDGSTTTDASGNYSFQVTYSSWWSGTVTPSKTGYTFSPSSRTYNFLTSNQTNQNYTATAITYTISGSTGTAGGGATITYTGGSTTANASTGNYSFTVAYGWSGTVTPSKNGYTFTPASRSYSNVTSNQTSQNYTATSTALTISGNAGTGGAILSYTDGTPKTATANSSGVYTFQVSSGWSGTVTPSKTGFTFVPGNRAYTNVIANQTEQNYTARPTTFSFASMGDGQAEAAYFTTTVNQIQTLNPALVLYNGDLEDTGFVTTQINPMINALKAANLFNNTFLVRGNADNFVSGSATLWENYFETAPNIKVLPQYVVNKTALDSASDNLNYSFEYGNSIFIGLDVPGDIDNLTTTQMNFLDSRLTYAEGQGLTHAFIFFHGPEYPVTSIHSLCSSRTDSSCTPPGLMTIFNNHPIVSATFHGHEHVLGWTHMDNTRIAGLTRSYEQFITSPSGSATYNEYVYPDRIDYVYPDMDNSQGFATISVDGLSFTYKIYKVGTTQPVWSHTFSKLNTAPTISDITDQTTNEDTATGDLSFTVGDVETPATFLTVSVASSNTTLVPSESVSLGGSGASRTVNITPASNQSGTATITVSVMDGSTVTSSDNFLLTVNAVNDAPVAEAQSVSLSWNTSIDLTLTGTDVEGSPLTYSIVDDPAHGSLSGSGADRTYTPTANYSGTDSFTFTANDGTVDSVPGTVSINVTAHTISGNAGVAGATLTYIDGTSKTVTADGAGLYSFQVPTDWSGTVMPSKAGYNFSPTSMTYTNVLADQTAQNYTTSGVTFTISGNAGMPGVTLSYTEGTPKTVTTDEAGMYSFEVPYNWSGIVTPSLSGYGFKPATRTYTNLTSNQFAQDYSTTTARVYYVDKTNAACTDVGTVGSFAVPFCTIGRGAYLATAGQIVHVLHGTYAETVTPRFSGTVGNPITYWADSDVTVTGTPQLTVSPYTAYPGFAVSTKSYIVIDGFNITQTGTKGIYADSSSYLTITNNHVTYAGAPSTTHPYEQGIYLKTTTNSTITGNTTDHNTCIGIRLLNNSNYNLVSNNISFSNFSIVESDAAGIETTGSSYNTIINNVTYSNEDSGINIYVNSSTGVQSTNNLVIGNLSYENGDHGIDTNNSPYNTFVGNTVHGNGTTGINVEGEASTGSHHTTLINNISAGNGFTPPAGSFAGNLRVDSASITGTTLDYNLFNRESAAYQLIWNDVSYPSLAAFQAAVPTQEVHGLEGDPKFVDPVPSVLRQTGVHYVGLGIFGNYYPEAGSPAIDNANSNAPSEPLYDIAGNSRIDDPATPNTGTGVRTYDDRGAYEYLPAGPSLPTVTTQAVTGITSTTATGNGNITAPGLPNPTQHGVVWGTSPDPTLLDSKTLDGPVSATGPYTSAITGLTPGTLYHVRAYATNDVGTVYGEDVSFTALLLPTVTTQAVTNITLTTATGNGNVTALGVPNPTQHGVVWSTSLNPTLADSKTTDGPVSATGAFTSNITGLTPGTLYHVRAYATNTVGTFYGEDVTFTAHIVPTVTTQAVTDITTTTATGNGNVTALGVPNPTQHGVVWSTSLNPTIADSKTTDGPVSATGAFTSNITGLIPGTLYHVRAYATNAAGTAYGEDISFTSLLTPTVTTQAVTGITTTTAIGNGNITALGSSNPTQHGVVWSISLNPTLADNKTTDGPVSVTGAFTSNITGLTPGIQYHVRAYATSAAGTSYGEDVIFRSLIVPTVTTQAVTNVTTTTATGHGTIMSLGVPNPTQFGVVWDTAINPTVALTTKTEQGVASITGAFTSNITGLTPGTLYHVRAYATNAAGTSYGEDVTFTAYIVPTVTTQAVTDITTTTATGNGNVTALGVPNPTQHGVVWSTSLNPTIADSKTTDGPVSMTGAFTSNISGLTAGTLYHVRAYATNAAGTAYGDDVTFTSQITPTVTTQAVTGITTTTATGNGNITALGLPNPTQHGVVWSTSLNPTTADNKTTDGPANATGVFTSSITGLTPGTLYHVRAYATNAAGTAYGGDVTFTAYIESTVTTQAVTGITTTTATGNGNVTALGVPNPTEHGMVWSTSLNPTTADSKTTDGPVSATGAFTSNITGLAVGMQYHVRAYATNAAGTVYGDDVVFTTLPSSTSTTTPATNAGAGADVSGAGTGVWTNPGFITIDDTNYAQVTINTATSHYLEGTNYGFAIPSNATINGIVVTIGRYESGASGVRDSVVRLLKSGAVTGSNKAATSTEWPSGSPVAAVYGTTSDLWGTTWTPAEINASGFGVALSATSTANRVAYVDYMQISVTYTVNVASSTTSVNCGAGTPIVTYGSNLTCVATVTRGSGTFTPSGNVSWTTNGSGSFVTSPCVLSGSGATATCSVTYTPSSVGSNGLHSISASYAGDANFYSSNGSQTVTVNKKDALVTPNPASKTYGEVDPILTGTLTGFMPADSVTATYNRVTGEAVGTYVISATLDPAGVLGNYNISYNTANFTITPQPEYTLTIDTVGSGSVTRSLPGPYHLNDVVVLTAVADTGWSFTGWSGACSGSGACSVTIDGNKTVTATFTQNEYSLTIVSDHGTVTPGKVAPYHLNDVVLLTAAADAGWAFSNWTGDLVSSNNPDSVTIHGDTTVTANYIAVSVAPSFTSAAVTSVNEDALYTYNITATDPNVDDTLTITATTKPAWLTFTDNGSGSATLTGTPTNAEVGNHDVVLHVSDGTLSADQTFSIAVANTNDAPSFTSTAVTEADEDIVYMYDITVSDPDVGDILAISAPTLPAWLTLTDHGNGTATLTGTPTNAEVGIHNVTLRVNDGTVDVDQGFTIDVGNTNDGPTFTSEAVTSVDEDALYTYNITATDPDVGDTLIISAPTLPAWLTLTDHGNGTATLTGTPTNSEVGDHLVVLQVSDSIELASQSFTIIVANTNDAPVLAQPVDQNNVKGAVVSLQISATDVDAGDTLTYAASGLPVDLSIDPSSGLISGTLTTTGTSNVTVTVNDGNGGTDSKSFDWVVTEPTYTLTVNKAGNGTITPDKAAPYYLNDVVVLTAVADEGWVFSGWTGCVATGNTCSVTMDADKTITATFTFASLLPGIADDIDSLWNYSGDWMTYNGAGPYSNTLHYSNTIGDSAEIMISGSQQIKLTYVTSNNRGVTDVYIDGVKIASIDAYSPLVSWQRTWTSGVLTNGFHTVRLVHASGAVTDIDAIEAIETFATPSLPPSIVDDIDSLWSYSGDWTLYSGGGPYLNSLHYSTTVGDYAQIAISGSQQIKLTYVTASNRGVTDVYVDGVKIASIDAYSPLVRMQRTWTSGVLTSGFHTVRLVHASGAVTDIDAIETIETFVTPSLPPGIVDDVDSLWSYSGDWTLYSGGGPYLDSLHYSTTVGDYAQIAISGSQQIKLTYVTAYNRGVTDVYVDGVKIASIDANSPIFSLQKTWTSGVLTSGLHTVRLVHASGAVTDIDAIETIEIFAAPSLLPGTADDVDSLWSYSGNWTMYSGGGPYLDSLHYSTTVGDYAQIAISGSQQIKLTYVTAYNRGVTDVYVDGVKIASIDANSPIFSLQKTWTSGVLTSGLHTVRLVHASGAVTDIDAIEAIETFVTPSLHPGIADDVDSLWSYSGDWTIYSGGGPYSDSLHYSSTIGDSAQIIIEGGQQIKLTYVTAENRGVADVYIDDIKVASIDAYSPIFSLQATWTSDILTSGLHTVRFVHASGAYTDIDALEVLP